MTAVLNRFISEKMCLQAFITQSWSVLKCSWFHFIMIINLQSCHSDEHMQGKEVYNDASDIIQLDFFVHF